MTDTAVLLDILRCELDATNHQFTHILILQHWKYDDEAARITEIDNIDFANAMRIIDYLVSHNTPFELDSPRFDPGTNLHSILLSERSSEARLLAALERPDCLDPTAQALVDAAKVPRHAYELWLNERIVASNLDYPKKETSVEALHEVAAQLITLIEQTLIHAYVEWHAGNVAAADAAWISSGAAMMHLTRLVKLCARLPAVPAAVHCPRPDLRHQPGTTLAVDRQRASQCAQAAQQAANDCEHAAIAGYCSTIAKSCQAFAEWDAVSAHPDIDTTPAMFHSFASTLQKFGL